MYDFTDMIQKYVDTNLSPVIKLSSGAYVTCEKFTPATSGLNFYRNNHYEAVCSIEGTYSEDCSFDEDTGTWDYIEVVK